MGMINKLLDVLNLGSNDYDDEYDEYDDEEYDDEFDDEPKSRKNYLVQENRVLIFRMIMKMINQRKLQNQRRAARSFR